MVGSTMQVGGVDVDSAATQTAMDSTMRVGVVRAARLSRQQRCDTITASRLSSFPLPMARGVSFTPVTSYQVYNTTSLTWGVNERKKEREEEKRGKKKKRRKGKGRKEAGAEAQRLARRARERPAGPAPAGTCSQALATAAQVPRHLISDPVVRRDRDVFGRKIC